MKRRTFLVGAGGIAIGGGALLGSGAFSRVESQRAVTIQVAPDPDAYLGMDVIEGSANSENYVDLDEKGHLYIDVGENPNGGEGVNSDSFTYFDDLFELCNNGKADADISYELPAPAHPSLGEDWEAPDEDYDEQVVAFYWVDDDGERHIVEADETVELELGECENIGLRIVTKSVDATEDVPLLDGEIVLTADAPGAGGSDDEDDDDGPGEPAHFTCQITAANGPGGDGELAGGDDTLEVTAEVENQGGSHATQTVQFREATVASRYAAYDGVVRMEGLLDAISEYREGEIPVTTLVEVIDAYRSGEDVDGPVLDTADVALDAGEDTARAFTDGTNGTEETKRYRVRTDNDADFVTIDLL